MAPPRRASHPADVLVHWRPDLIPLGLWHCFGADDRTKVDLRTVRAMLKASGTRLLPINTSTYELKLGHGDALWADLKPEAFTLGLTPALNINHQTSAATAIRQALWARELSGIRLLKLEVLNDDHVTSNDRACLIASQALSAEGFSVMPLISDNPDIAAELVWVSGVEVLRVMGSPIGSGLGVQNTLRVGNCADTAGIAHIPAVLDGGVGSVHDASVALDLGYQGVLVNSCLFKHADGPVAALREFAAVFASEPVAA